MRAVFLGAGASKAFGYPLTGEILPQIRTRLKAGESVFRDGTSTGSEEKRLKSWLSQLMPGFFDESLALPLITDILSLIDHSLIHGQAPGAGMTRDRLTEFRVLLERAMLHIIDPDEYFTPRQLEELRRFIKWVSKEPGTAVVSTNYDISIEHLWFESYDSNAAIANDFDFGVRWRDPDTGAFYENSGKTPYHLYKLHGSVNWLRCEMCEDLYINPQGPMVDLPFIGRDSTMLACHCGHAPLRPVLVTPTLVRDVRDPNLLALWQRALERLRAADEWVLIGYSMPPEDIAIRSLLIRAYQGRPKRPRITVVQRGEGALPSYRLFFPACDYQAGGLEAFLNTQGV